MLAGQTEPLSVPLFLHRARACDLLVTPAWMEAGEEGVMDATVTSLLTLSSEHRPRPITATKQLFLFYIHDVSDLKPPHS